MKALILAAGYATRLYRLAEKQPKPLLEVAGKAIVEYTLEKLRGIKEIKEVYLITNHRFYDQFRVWLSNYRYSGKIKLIDDGTLSNDDRLGAVGDLNFVLQEEDIDEDLLIIAGDNLFSFSLRDLVDFQQKKGKSVVAFRDLKDKEKVKRRYGVGVLKGTKIIGFEEKPWNPSSSLASTACYLIKQSDFGLVSRAVKEGRADNLGDFIQFLSERSEVHGFVFDQPWFDVGSFESLKEAEEFYQK